MPKNFNTIKKYLSDEEKFEDALFEYNFDRDTQVEPIYIYPEGYHEMTDEEIEHDELISQKIFEAEMNDDKEEAENLIKKLMKVFIRNH